ncbi:MAG: TIGR03560 family F420-dependent LLM class oxidoreductase [Acidimicrobiia bacterium]|nr:TIGR03560 family F420-dependent LLM class oxidoreductase [Acidimicrobiia bacterium]
MDFGFEAGSIAKNLGEVVAASEEIGVHSIWFMDHLFQIPMVGPPTEPMLEAYSALSWTAGRTSRLQLGALVTAVPYRHPGLLLKTVSSLDVLSEGRAWLGLGAAWNDLEARSLGLPFPRLATRFEQLEEVLRIADQMFSDDPSPFRGRHYHLEEPVNHPMPVRRPPILIGGGGEKKTLRLVAEHADATNLFEGQVAHKLAVLRNHCEKAGRPFEDIVVTTTGTLGPTNSVDSLVNRLGTLSDLGVDLALLDAQVPFDRTARYLAEVIPQVRDLGRPVPPLLT